METVNICLVTFNCARAPIQVDQFATDCVPRTSEVIGSADVIVLSLQEIAPLANAFLGGRFLLPYVQRFVDAFQTKDRRAENYEPIASHNVGMTAIVILVKSALRNVFRVSAIAGVGVGCLQLGNKGAVALRLSVQVKGDDVANMTFVAAHLAPMEQNWKRRNKDWQNIVRGLSFRNLGSKTNANLGGEVIDHASENAPLLAKVSMKNIETDPGLFCNHCPVFLAGDLNYRTSDVKPGPSDYENFPKPNEFRYKTARDGANTGAFALLKHNDQLSRERAAGRTCHRLAEMPIMFPPTYKYVEHATEPWSTSDSDEPEVWSWAKHRFPSWCDRILFSMELMSDASTLFRPTSYRALPLQPGSDHRPVALHFSVNMSSLASHDSPLNDITSPFPLNPRADADRAYARLLELLVGTFAYIVMTWEGMIIFLALICGAFGGCIVVKSMHQYGNID